MILALTDSSPYFTREKPHDMKTILALSALIASVTLVNSSPSVGTPTTPAVHTVAPLHCQVPCGIYGDKMRIDMLMEDCATIEKAMTTLQAMDAEESPSKNQMVRWVMTKEQHAQSIQDTVAAYWLAQRVKAPKDAAGSDKYHAQLKSMHQITVAAMKCKQTTDKSHVSALRKAASEFSAGYFTAEDLKHLNSHEHSEGK
jgi:nickel superoxide dismutase